MSGEGPIGNLACSSTAGDLGEDLTRYLIVPSSQSTTGFGSLRNYSQEKGNIGNSVDELKRHLITPTSHATTSFESLTKYEPVKTKIGAPSMDIAIPVLQPSTMGGRIVDDPSSHGVFKLEDFLAKHKAEHDARQEAALAAKNHAAEPTQLAPPAAKKVRIAADAASLAPVAVGARSSQHIVLLHEKVQALALPLPSFVYSGGTCQGWTVELSFPCLDVQELQSLKEDAVFNSKQEAKEAASKTALAILEQLQEQGRIGKSRKDKHSSEWGVRQEMGMKEPGPNYIGQLLEFQRATGSPQPIYNEYRSGTRFACLISIDGHPTPFGSLTALHATKKAARQDAARHAVAHFKSIGTWPAEATPVGGIKKPKSPSRLSTPTSSTRTSSTPTTPSKIAPSTPSTPGESYASRTAQLATQLSLPCPEYVYTPHPSDANFHSVACFFRGTEHVGPIGEVRNVFGRKKAKEECARLVLVYLDELKEMRMAYGREMMTDVGGGMAVGEAALGECVGDKKDTRSNDDEDGFEDALESLPG